MTSVAPSGTITLVVSSAVVALGRPVTGSTIPWLRSGWISIRTMPSLETNGRNRSSVPVFRNWTSWVVLVKFCDVIASEPQAGAELDLGTLLVQDEDPRAGQDLGAPHESRGPG